MVSFSTLKIEKNYSNLTIIEEGITYSISDFDKLMYVVVKRR